MRILKALGWLLLASGSFVDAKTPDIVEATPFPGRPDTLFYFEDSETVLTIDYQKLTLYMSDNGGKDWVRPGDVDQEKAYKIYMHPRDNKIAVIVGDDTKHWITTDQGKSWRSFNTPQQSAMNEAISFHYSDPNKMLFHTPHYMFSSVGQTYYTTDGFKTVSMLHDRRRHCNWAKSTELFQTGNDKFDHDRILCIAENPNNDKDSQHQLLVSDDFFKTSHEPKVFNDRTVAGMVNMASVKGFIVVAAKAVASKELVLYVTKDTETWHRAIFGEHRIEEDSYTILESTNYSLQVQVTTEVGMNMGVLFSSNSNGTYFTKLHEHVNRDEYGIMDFEKIPNIQGVFLINIVDNWKEAEDNPLPILKHIKSKITFDDGRTFEALKVGGDELHLHSVTDLSNTGRVFSSLAPGILMGNGNTGDFLKLKSTDPDLFVSDDAGRSWKTTPLKGPHKYEFGDQGGILVAIKSELTDKLSYSIDHGKTWEELDLGRKVLAFELTTVPDSTSMKFLLSAEDVERNWYLYALDFNELHERKCEKDDFEKWYARLDPEGKPDCIMGHTQHFQRRKADAKCTIGVEFKEALPVSEKCDCTDEDFECDFNFRRVHSGKDCELVGKLLDPEGQCKTREDKFMGSSGWRLIPGNDCERRKGAQKDELKEHSCEEVLGNIASGEIQATFHSFTGSHFRATYYLERDPKLNGDDETVLAQIDQIVWKSHDHGKTWSEAVPGDHETILAIYPHSFNNDYVYFLTNTKTVYYSKDRAKHIHRFEAPDVPNVDGLPALAFHQKRPDWLLWTGDRECSKSNSDYCRVTAHISQKNGAMDSWELLLPYVKRCQFMYREKRKNDESLIFCEHWKTESPDGPLQLLSSNDTFVTKKQVFDDVVDFATMAEFIIVAAKSEDKQYLSAYASIDGAEFAHAAFPKNFPVKHESAYTVLDSETNAIFLHVTEYAEKDREYGPIMKSNTNGTSYVISIRDVNRDSRGYVDWEKVAGIEGVAIVNVVGNVEDVKKGVSKKVKTMITHDDGSTWSYLRCPEKDLDGKSSSCDADDLSKRSLHLHGYTERKDPRDTFSSPSAVGLMIGVGNVGEYLGLYNEGNTYMTKDGGVTWTQIQKGTFMWEYGDQGSIIVLVERNNPTNKILYSIDEGATWHEKVFDDDGVTTVERITTVPSDNSRNFLLWGTKDRKLTTVNLDFTGMTETKCFLPDKEHYDDPKSDYDLWSPAHPNKKEEVECLFGHQSLYYRKKPDSNCYNGPLIDRLHTIEKNCTCTRQDFECDYNFERTLDGSCNLVTGVEPLPAEHVCTDDTSRVEYWDITGYRKIPLSTCAGGRELQYGGEPHACPNHEAEFEKKYSVSGATIFFAIIVPIGAACVIGWYVYQKWDGKFGRIRLGEAGESAFSSEQPWIKWPIAVISGIVAVAAALPLLIGSLWRNVSGRLGGGYGTRTYTSRDSFARGRGDYAEVDPDEGELLGDDSDEEV